MPQSKRKAAFIGAAMIVLLTMLLGFMYRHRIRYALIDKRDVETIIKQIEPGVLSRLEGELLNKKLNLPFDKIIILAIKDQQYLEVWVHQDGQLCLFKTYPFTAYSGTLGPKIKEGDKQIPEGIYRVVSLNPNSYYYLSIETDYPNEFDKEMAKLDGRSDLGGDIFIHGKEVTIGCIPVGDEAIEELFYLVAKTGCQNSKVLIAPYDMRKNIKNLEVPFVTWEDKLYKIIEEEMINYKGKDNSPQLDKIIGINPGQMNDKLQTRDIKNDKELQLLNGKERMQGISIDMQASPDVKVMMDIDQSDTNRHLAAQKLKQVNVEDLVQLSSFIIEHPKEGERFKAFCIQYLWECYPNLKKEKQKEVRDKLHDYLQNPIVRIQREALLALVRIKDQKGIDTAISWLNDPSPDRDNVRDAAIRCIKLLDLKDQIQAIRDCLNHKNEIIRISAIVALSEWGDQESKIAFEEAAKSDSIRLRRAGKAALKRLEKVSRKNNTLGNKNSYMGFSLER